MTCHSNETSSATSTSRLRTSSNTPSVQKKDTNGDSMLISNEGERAFHLTNFILRSAWANWHNSKWHCNLDELVNQPKLIYSLVFNTKTKARFHAPERVMSMTRGPRGSWTIRDLIHIFLRRIVGNGGDVRVYGDHPTSLDSELT
jgi:hypothetical protein